MDMSAPFATTVAGQIFLPAIAGLLVAVVIGGFAWLRKQDQLLYQIRNEVQTNGGGSLKDAVNRTEARTIETANKLDQHLSDARYQQGRMDRMIEKMAGLPDPA